MIMYHKFTDNMDQNSNLNYNPKENRENTNIFSPTGFELEWANPEPDDLPLGQRALVLLFNHLDWKQENN